ncbi:HEAT repeat domain-containing protein [Rubidibacter lacunae]|nr:HEAT repeat domain-containing protein [Rubidibacter lacunae]
MSNLLKKAAAAGERQDWVAVGQYLQALPWDCDSPFARAGDWRQGIVPTIAERSRALDLALQVLQAGDFQLRWDVAKVFAKFGDAAIAPLLEFVEDEDAELELRWYAVRILAGFDDPRVVLALVELAIATEDEELAITAARTLSEFGDSAVSALAELLAAPDDRMRLLAAQALAWIRRPATISPLLSAADDSLPIIRATAVEALCSFHDPRVPPVAISALQDLDPRVRREAISGLSFVADPEEWDLVARLQPLLYDLDHTVCHQAAIALGRIGNDAAVAELARLLRSQRTPCELRIVVVQSLSWAQTARALEIFAAELAAPVGPAEQESPTEKTVVEEIVIALGRWRAPESSARAAEVLVAFARQLSASATLPSASLQKALAVALGNTYLEQATAPLCELAVCDEKSVRLHALSSLQKLPAGCKSLQDLQDRAPTSERAREIESTLADVKTETRHTFAVQGCS